MKNITYEQFDTLCENAKKIEFKPDGWFPTVDEIEENIKPNVYKMINFILWILENNDLPKTKEDKESFKLLNKLIKDNYNFVE